MLAPLIARRQTPAPAAGSPGGWPPFGGAPGDRPADMLVDEMRQRTEDEEIVIL